MLAGEKGRIRNRAARVAEEFREARWGGSRAGNERDGLIGLAARLELRRSERACLRNDARGALIRVASHQRVLGVECRLQRAGIDGAENPLGAELSDAEDAEARLETTAPRLVDEDERVVETGATNLRLDIRFQLRALIAVRDDARQRTRSGRRHDPRDRGADGDNQQARATQHRPLRNRRQAYRSLRGEIDERRNRGEEKSRPGKKAVEPIRAVGDQDPRGERDEEHVPSGGAPDREQPGDNDKNCRQRPLEQIAIEAHEIPRHQHQSAQRRVLNAVRVNMEADGVSGSIERLVSEQERTARGTRVGE